MTEAEWLACDDPQIMVETLSGRGTDRQLRLCGIAVVFAYSTPSPYREMLEGLLAISETPPTRAQYDVIHERFHSYEANLHYWAPIEYIRYVVGRATSRDGVDDQRGSYIVALLRDIFGNPFRPATFDPAWRTSTATALARQMYESRDFGAMPILADALQDAGCTSDDILNHCRDPRRVHVRGCWVVDLVLGKS